MTEEQKDNLKEIIKDKDQKIIDETFDLLENAEYDYCTSENLPENSFLADGKNIYEVIVKETAYERDNKISSKINRSAYRVLKVHTVLKENEYKKGQEVEDYFKTKMLIVPKEPDPELFVGLYGNLVSEEE